MGKGMGKWGYHELKTIEEGPPYSLSINTEISAMIMGHPLWF